MLFPIADSQFVLGLWQAEDMVGDNFDIYEFDGSHAELIAKDLPLGGDFVLTGKRRVHRGIFAMGLEPAVSGYEFSDISGIFDNLLPQRRGKGRTIAAGQLLHSDGLSSCFAETLVTGAGRVDKISAGIVDYLSF